MKPAGTFSPSNKVPSVDGGTEAVEALFLATLNVTSFATLIFGGALWAFDISTVDDFRKRVRQGMYSQGEEDNTPEKAEEDIEEWMAIVMARMQGKSEADVAKMVAQGAQKAEEEQNKRTSTS